MSNPTIGFIGYGNMAQAIAEGLVNAGTISGNDIVACAAHYDKLECNAAKLGVKAVHTAAQVAEAADVVVIAIKPYQIEAVISPIVDKLAQPNTIVVSIAAGWDLNKFRPVRNVFRTGTHPMHHSEHADGCRQRRAGHGNRQHAHAGTDGNLRKPVFVNQPD